MMPSAICCTKGSIRRAMAKSKTLDGPAGFSAALDALLSLEPPISQLSLRVTRFPCLYPNHTSEIKAGRLQRIKIAQKNLAPAVQKKDRNEAFNTLPPTRPPSS